MVFTDAITPGIPDSATAVVKILRIAREAEGTVPRPHFSICPPEYDEPTEPGDPRWFVKEKAEFKAYRATCTAAAVAAVKADVSVTWLRQVVEQWRRNPLGGPVDPDELFTAYTFAEAALEALTMERRFEHLRANKAALPIRVCPGCAITLPFDSWGLGPFDEPFASACSTCREMFRNDALDFDWHHCCSACHRWFQTAAVDPGDTPPHEGEEGYDPEKSAAWMRARYEYDAAITFSSPDCFVVGVGATELTRFAADEVPRTWEGQWPMTTFLDHPPRSVSERIARGPLRDLDVVKVRWTGTEAVIVSGRPIGRKPFFDWMWTDPRFVDPCREYAVRLRRTPIAVSGGAVHAVGGLPQRALTAGDSTDTVIDAELVRRPSTKEQILAFLRDHAPATDNEIAAALDRPIPTVKEARRQLAAERSILGNSGRPERWRLAD